MIKLLLILGFASLVDAWQPVHPVVVAPDGITGLDAAFGTSHATAKIHTVMLEEGAENGGERNRGFHCSGGRIPCSPVLDLEVDVGGQDIPVPPSAFADVADINVAELKQTGDGMTLYLACGDAASSYSVRIEFDAYRIRKRQIISGFGTNEVVEETIYNELTPLD